MLYFSTPRPRLGFVFIHYFVYCIYYLVHISTQTRASLSVGFCLFVCLLACLFSLGLFFSLFLCFTKQRPRLGSLLYLLYRAPQRNSSAVASRGRHGGCGAQQHLGSRQELPRLRRQEQGFVSRVQQQAARLPCLSTCSKAVFEVFQGKAQPSSTLGSTDTATLNAVAEHKWLQANQDL